MRSSRILSLAGFAVLVITTFTLFFSNFAESLKYDYFVFFSVINLAALAGLLHACIAEFRDIINFKFPFKLTGGDAANFLGVLLGTFVTFHMSCALGLGAVTAAGLTGITASVLFPKQSVAAYCGAFVGMSCPVAFCSYPPLFLAAVIAGALFVASKNTLNGFGGKLGTIAFFGAVSALFLTGRAGSPGNIPGLTVKIYIMLCSVFAAIATFVMSIRLGKGPVFASALIGLAAGLLLPGIYPRFGELLAVVAICASFAGMSSPERITTNLQMVLAGILSGIFFIYTLTHFPGAGGKLGTIAFMSCIAVKGLSDILKRFRGTGAPTAHPAGK